MFDEMIKQKTAEIEDYVIDLRREFHRHPEVSGTEEWTSLRVRQEIEKYGLPYQMVSKTGLIATLDTGREGGHVALRADIDALPVRDHPENLKGAKVVLSENEGFCHACGHDAHMAMLLGAMRILVDIKDQLSGQVYFCFEEGEENGGGWRGIMEGLAGKRVDTFWGIHVYSALESGKICVDPGPRMAGAALVDVTVHGKGGHGSRPDLSVSPIFAAACILNNLTAAWVNQIDANETVTLGLTAFHAGTDVYNVIPETARFLGSLRFFNRKEGAKADAIVREISEATAKMHHCTVSFGPQFLGIPVVNDAACAERAAAALSAVLPEGAVSTCPRWYASESMAMYLDKYPGILAFLGIRNEAYGSGAEHHNEHFDVDEGVLTLGVLSTVKYATSFLCD